VDTAVKQPRVTVIEITDPTDARAGIEFMDVDAIQLRSERFRVRRVIVQFDKATVVFHSTNLRIRTRTRVRGNLLAYVAFGDRARGTVNGLQVRPGLLLAVEPGAEATFVTDSGWEGISFLLAPAEVRAHLALRQPEAEFRLPQGVETLQVSAKACVGLFNWGRRLVDIAEAHPDMFNEAINACSNAEAELLEMLLTALSAASDSQPDREDRMRRSQADLVKLVEHSVLADSGNRLLVTDLCRIAGVGERTLQHAFKDATGLTPLAYLIRVRLHRVRQALLAANRGSTTVSAEAVKWGFWHFGEFAGTYKACFGETPSQTLRRKAGDLAE
jgi:AraC-like DNA-binding protein